MDMVSMQHQIRRNAEEMQSIVADLEKWENDIQKKDEKLVSAPTPVRVGLPPVRSSFETKQVAHQSQSVASEHEQAAVVAKDAV